MKINIDTLFFSGGGLNCFLHLGSLKYLIDINGISPELDGINNIITVSGGMIVILPFILGYTFNKTYDLFHNFSIQENVKVNKLNDIIKGNGVYSNTIIIDFIRKLLIDKSYNPDITLKELYLKTGKNLLLKVYNINRSIIEYINHETYPDIILHTAICMSSAAPIVFPPIRYNNELFCDGGVCGGFPYEKLKDVKYKNFIGVWITGNKRDISGDKNKTKENIKINDMLHYISIIYDTYGYTIEKTKSQKNRIITIYKDGTGLNFNRKENKYELFMKGYNSTKQHFKNIIENNKLP